MVECELLRRRAGRVDVAALNVCTGSMDVDAERSGRGRTKRVGGIDVKVHLRVWNADRRPSADLRPPRSLGRLDVR